MKIRSITYFCDPDFPLDLGLVEDAGAFVRETRAALEAGGFEVQTSRLATVPFPRLFSNLEIGFAAPYVKQLVTAAREQGFDYLSLGPALPGFLPSYDLISEILAISKEVFLAGVMTTVQGEISLPAVRGCARVIQRCSGMESNGFTNLRFTALANVPAGGPFFPAAYHAGGPPVFALALEAADLAVTAFSAAEDLFAARQGLIEAIESHGRRLTQLVQPVTARFDVPFGGLDFSLAPFPEQVLSLGTALERLGSPALGLPGSLTAAAILAETIDQADFPRAGFNGLMLPVLEDATLAQRVAEGILTIKDLLLYAAVCGTGLDTVPLPGDVSVDQLTALLLDVAALALRLDKPLTARLMPIPGKCAGDWTDFDFPYFVNSRVMALEGAPIETHLDGANTFPLHSRNRISTDKR